MKRIILSIFICFSSFCVKAGQTHDRWLEVDINWFNPETIDQQAKQFIETYEPLLKDADGDKGVLICPNWLVDIITEFSGDMNQNLPFKGSIFKQWNNRTYNDFTRLVQALKTEASKKGLANFRVGIFMVAWPDIVVTGIYDLKGQWKVRHPESVQGNNLIPQSKLNSAIPMP